MTLPCGWELQGWEAIGTKRQSRHSVFGERMAAYGRGKGCAMFSIRDLQL